MCDKKPQEIQLTQFFKVQQLFFFFYHSDYYFSAKRLILPVRWCLRKIFCLQYWNKHLLIGFKHGED